MRKRGIGFNLGDDFPAALLGHIHIEDDKVGMVVEQAALDLPDAPEQTTFTFDTAAPGTLTFKASNLKAGAPIPTTSDFAFTLDVTP